MTKMTFDKFCTIEWELDCTVGALNGIARPDVLRRLKAAAYYISVLRSAAYFILDEKATEADKLAALKTIEECLVSDPYPTKEMA